MMRIIARIDTRQYDKPHLYQERNFTQLTSKS